MPRLDRGDVGRQAAQEHSAGPERQSRRHHGDGHVEQDEGGQEVKELVVLEGGAYRRQWIDAHRLHVETYVAPGAGQGQVARGEGDDRRHRRHGLKAEQVADDAAAHQGQRRSQGAEEDLPGHHAHPVPRGDRDLRQQRLEGTAGEGAEQVERLQHEEEVKGVGHALAADGRQPEQEEEEGVEGRRQHHKGDAPPPAGTSAVAPPADERIIQCLDQAGDGEQQPEDKDGDSWRHVGVGGRGVEVDEPQVFGAADDVTAQAARGVEQPVKARQLAGFGGHGGSEGRPLLR
jgi:hypothetical protein